MTQTPFDIELDRYRDELAAADHAYNAALERLAARTAADDAKPGDLAAAQVLWRQVQVDCWRAEVFVAAFETMQRQWRAAESADAADTADEEREAVAFWKAAKLEGIE